MTENPLIVDVAAEGRATVTLNRPDVHNAFDDKLIALLTRELDALDRNPTVGVVVLAAAGKSFCAGADLKWMRRMAEYSEAENQADAEALAALMKTLNRLSKPTVAEVQGAAYGGGVGLICCCDIAIASEAAQFSISEVKLGLIPSVISPYVVAVIGERQRSTARAAGHRGARHRRHIRHTGKHRRRAPTAQWVIRNAERQLHRTVIAVAKPFLKVQLERPGLPGDEHGFVAPGRSGGIP